jgi:hypothetical protein
MRVPQHRPVTLGMSAVSAIGGYGIAIAQGTVMRTTSAHTADIDRFLATHWFAFLLALVGLGSLAITTFIILGFLCLQTSRGWGALYYASLWFFLFHGLGTMTIVAAQNGEVVKDQPIWLMSLHALVLVSSSTCMLVFGNRIAQALPSPALLVRIQSPATSVTSPPVAEANRKWLSVLFLAFGAIHALLRFQALSDSLIFLINVFGSVTVIVLSITHCILILIALKWVAQRISVRVRVVIRCAFFFAVGTTGAYLAGLAILKAIGIEPDSSGILGLGASINLVAAIGALAITRVPATVSLPLPPES